MNDQEAQMQQLPGSDVYRRDQACYVNEINRKAAAARLLRAGYFILLNTWIIKHYKEQKYIDFYTWYLYNEYIIDLMRIQVCFEHYLKALFLLKGFVIHEFQRPAKHHAKKLRDQATGLVSIAALTDNFEFTYIPAKQYNEITALDRKTVGFSQLIKLPTIHQMPHDVVTVLLQQRDVRNVLHYTEDQPELFDPTDIQEVMEFADSTIPPLVNEIADQLGTPNVKIEFPDE